MDKFIAELLGTAFLLATVIGSGIMGETLADGNTAIALLGNTIATGAILYVLITILGPVSGAHFNPVVTIAFWIKGEISTRPALVYIVVQILGGIIGVWAAHLMFEQPIFQASQKLRAGPAQGFSEIVATFGLLMVIFGGIRHRPDQVAGLVGFYITAAYWFTASTSFANPAVTLARTLSDTFAGINALNAPMFVICQIVGMFCALCVARWVFPPSDA
ncbi:MIP family protein [Amylibacter marinus]|uniref:MIP family protein n=1 Tax=Amylibacter marinus TaxID=1475483 RepID=A0ABQ5VT57_9RHOB|nr:MIP/aquaporin family protein [Amylibacter marinus]GLQ34303.1 MIP family protein [Amylibacter marinus]